MVSFGQILLPISLSAVFVFFASSMLNMLLRFWHAPDYRGFSNENEVGAAIREGSSTAGMYMIPYCKPETMKLPETQEKFRKGPIAFIALRQTGAMNMGASLGQWFVFCLLVTAFCGYLAANTLAAGSAQVHVLRVVGTAAFMGFALGPIPNAIWWGHPWVSVIKHVIDGLIYAAVTAATFCWLWPA
jgi:hypothetical protein